MDPTAHIAIIKQLKVHLRSMSSGSRWARNKEMGAIEGLAKLFKELPFPRGYLVRDFEDLEELLKPLKRYERKNNLTVVTDLLEYCDYNSHHQTLKRRVAGMESLPA